MKIYFPQWQGSGTGKNIALGAATILESLNDNSFKQISLSAIKAGVDGQKAHNINNYSAIVEQLERLQSEIDKGNPDTLQIIGGDCGLEIVPVSYLNKKYPNLGVIWFDAHADINRPCDSVSCNFHGMPLRTLLGEGVPEMNALLASTLAPSQIHYVGLRDIDQPEQTRIEEDNIYAPKTFDPQALVKTLEAKTITKLYLHFDFDCLDPKAYEKTYYQVPNGLSISEAEVGIQTLKDRFEIVGASVLESVTPQVSELKPIENILNLLLK
ncbi:arginase family protein [Maribacter sp. 2307UL18-2]|uniref:arginase family protein n=1 Tax=Maribacter sp. 2307UL18-2 TaxID=3386274 RepID=UPI0039BD5644